MRDETQLFHDYLRRPDRKGYAKLVRAFYDFAWSVALRTTRDREAAIDLTHDLFLGLLLHPPEPESVRSPRGWMASRILSLARRAWRRGEARKARELEAARRIAAPEGELGSEDVAVIHAEVGRLPARIRTAIELRYFAELSNREIACALDLSERSVEDDLRRGRSLLRSRLGRKLELSLPPAVVLAAGGSLGPPAELARELLRVPELSSALGSQSSALVLGGFAVKKLGAALAVAVVITGLIGFALFRESPLDDGLRQPLALDPVASDPKTGSSANSEALLEADPATAIDAAPPSSVPVRVVRGQGEAPVAGAVVVLRDASNLDEPSIESVTSDDGIATLIAPPGWSKALIEARLEAARSEAVEFALPAREIITLRLVAPTLPEEGVIRGHVLDASTGEPIAQARVRVDPGNEDGGVETDPDGFYEIAGLAGGRYRVSASADDHLELVEPIEIARGSEFTHEFELDPTISLRVVVVDEENLPLEGVTVSRAQLDGSYLGAEMSARKTNAEGVSVVEHVSLLRPQQLRAELDGFKTAWRRPELPLSDDQVPEFRIVLEEERFPERLVRGRVLDVLGSPAGRATVTWCTTWGDASERESVTTLPDGTFSLRFRTDHETCHVSALAPGRAPAVARNVPTGTVERPTEVELVLEPAHWLEGDVVDEDGKPIKSARVVAMPDRKLLDSQSARPGLARSTKTDEHGRFHLADIGGPRVALEATGPKDGGWAPAVEDEAPVDGVVRLVLLAPGLIRGRVTDADTGEPVPAFKVTFKPVGHGWPSGLWYPRVKEGESFASPDGVFVLENLPRSHRYDVTVEGPDSARAVLEKILPEREADASEHRVVLSRGSLLLGAVIANDSRAPISDATVVYAVWSKEADPSDSHGWTERPGYQRALTSDDGRFAFREDEPGTILVLARGYARRVISPADRELVLDRRTGDLVVPVSSGAALNGVHFEDGEPKPHTYVDLIQIVRDGPLDLPRVRWLGGSETQSDGSFGWESLEPGDYLVHHWRESPLSRRHERATVRLIAEITLAPGDARSITFGDELGSLVAEGHVVDPKKSPVHDVEIAFRPRFGWKYSELSTPVDGESGGWFRFDVLREGTYDVFVSKSQTDRRLLRSIEIRGGEELDLVLDD